MKSKLLIIRKQSGSRNLLPNDPRVFPPPGNHFLTPTTERPFYDWAHRQPSNDLQISKSYIKKLSSPN